MSGSETKGGAAPVSHLERAAQRNRTRLPRKQRVLKSSYDGLGSVKGGGLTVVRARRNHAPPKRENERGKTEKASKDRFSNKKEETS